MARDEQRGALFLVFQQSHDAIDVDGEAGPSSLQAPTGGRYSTPCGTPSPTEVKRTRKPYSESRGFRQVVYTTKGRLQCV